MKQYRAKNKERIAAQRAEYYQQNKEKIAEYKADWYQNNKDEIAARMSEYYQNNKDIFAENSAKYKLTKNGRAHHLAQGYRNLDKKNNRGECTITGKWILENIFTKPCHYCGETDWKKLGCDRIDNDLPHTPENVVPCCYSCNSKKRATEYDVFMKKIGQK